MCVKEYKFVLTKMKNATLTLFFPVRPKLVVVDGGNDGQSICISNLDGKTMVVYLRL